MTTNMNLPVLHEKFSQFKLSTRATLLDYNSTALAFNINLAGLQFVTSYEEFYLMDIRGLIGAIGGSLGLFLGFSVFHYIIDAFDFIISVITGQK